MVNIGIPTRGRARYLGEAVESVLAQSFDRWSLVVRENDVAGGPAERAVEPYLSDPRVRYVANGHDVGQARNHTLLLQEGTAPYVALLHDDDRWEPDFLARRVAFLERQPEAGFVFSGVTNVDEEGGVLWRSEILLPEGVHRSEDVVGHLLQYNCVGVPSRVLARRSAYEAAGDAFDERFLFWDYEMWFRLAARFPVGYLPLRDVAYRVHSQQTTFQAHYDRGEMLRFLDHVESVVERALPEFQMSVRARRRKRSAVMLSAALDAIQQGDRAQAAANLRSAVSAYPAIVLDPRASACLAALPFGARSGPWLAWGRQRVLDLGMRRGVSIHRR